MHALGTIFRTPVGLAAGFDKDAIGFDALGRLGFGFVEVGRDRDGEVIAVLKL